MILADTSVWIEFLKKSGDYFFRFSELLESNQVVTTEYIFAELLQGVRNKREEEVVLGYWSSLAKVEAEDIWIRAGQYSYEEKLFAKGIGLIDVSILLSARTVKAQIWTLDKKFQGILQKGEVFE